jgi:hypothetical protein
MFGILGTLGEAEGFRDEKSEELDICIIGYWSVAVGDIEAWIPR